MEWAYRFSIRPLGLNSSSSPLTKSDICPCPSSATGRGVDGGAAAGGGHLNQLIFHHRPHVDFHFFGAAARVEGIHISIVELIHDKNNVAM